MSSLLFAYCSVGVRLASYGLDAESVGLTLTISGLAELSGAILASLFTDRVYPPRAVFIGLLTSALFFFVLSFFAKMQLWISLVLAGATTT